MLRRLLVGACLLLTAGAPPTALAQTPSAPTNLRNQQRQPSDNRSWYEAYADGIKAVEVRNWAVAITSLELARSRGPRPGRNVTTYGDNATDFLPDFYLGRAYLASGRYKEADAAFKRVEQSKLITPRNREFATLVESGRQASVELLIASAESDTAAGRYGQALKSLAEARSLAPSDRRAESMMTSVNERMDTAKSAKPSPVQTTPIQPRADQTAVNLPDLSKQTSEIDLKAVSANALDARADAKTNATNGIVANSPAVEKTTARPRVRTSNTSVTAAQTTVAPQAPVQMPPFTGSERAALANFFAGNYAQVARLLEAQINSGNESRAAHFFLACSLAAMALRGEALGSLEDARTHYRDAERGQSLGDVQPFISPRVLALLSTGP